MELFIKDRLFFSKLLPECKTFLEFNTKRQLMQKIGISEVDQEKYEIKQDNESGTITWNPKTDSENPLKVDLTSEEKALLRRGIEALDGTPLPDDLWITAEKIWNSSN